MFRAGGTPGTATPELTANSAGPGIILADFSEYQPDIADAAYLAWSKAGIIRAMYGSQHDDGAWYGGARRDGLHAGGIRFLGVYQYLVAGQDAAVQAHALVNLVGHLRPGEKLICDIEEGPAAQQAARFRQWSAVITAAYGRPAAPWCYAGLDFGAAAGLSPQWVAAYRNTEPGGSHLLWQFTDAYPVPGVGTCDASVFRGTMGELAALGWQPPVPVPPKPVPVPQSFPVPEGLSVTAHPVVNLGWREAVNAQGVPSPHYRYIITGAGGVVAHDVVTTPGAQGVLLPGPGAYELTVQSAGNSPFSPPHPFTA
jgi:hypothetical protein